MYIITTITLNKYLDYLVKIFIVFMNYLDLMTAYLTAFVIFVFAIICQECVHFPHFLKSCNHLSLRSFTNTKLKIPKLR